MKSLVESQFLVSPLGGGDSVRIFEIVEAKSSDSEGIRADAGDLFIHIGIESLQQREDDHKRRNADDHSEQRQKRPQLV